MRRSGQRVVRGISSSFLALSISMVAISAVTAAPSEEPQKKSFLNKMISPFGGHEQSEAKATPPAKSAPPAKPIPAPTSRVVAQTAQTAPAVITNQTGMDTALLSVLRDITKALKESEDVGKVEDAAQKAALNTTIATLDSVVAGVQNNPNRIIDAAHKEQYEKQLLAEAWESGRVTLPDHSAASLSVLWAKKLNGLVNISVAGRSGNGDFIVVINGKSAIDTGFDIQSQSNVSFWIGKLNNFIVDTGEAPPEKQSAELPLIHAVTASQVATTPAVEVKPTQAVVAEAAPPMVAPAPAPTTEEVKQSTLESAPVEIHKTEVPATINETVTTTTTQESKSTETVAAMPTPEVTSPIKPAVEEAVTSTTAKAPAPVEKLEPKLPTADAVVLVPEHAVAGDYITVCVLGEKQHNPEAQIEIAFNGNTVLTSKAGLASFQVPEELPPGPTLQVSMSARPELPPVAVDVLQPLLRPTGVQVPRIDKVSKIATVGSTITIDGHNFDGLAERDHVMVDGSHEAHILVASPVQIKAIVPASLPAGQHSVLVTSNGLRSNVTPCTLVAARVEPAAPHASKRKIALNIHKHKNHRHTRLANKRRFL